MSAWDAPAIECGFLALRCTMELLCEVPFRSKGIHLKRGTGLTAGTGLFFHVIHVFYALPCGLFPPYNTCHHFIINDVSSWNFLLIILLDDNIGLRYFLKTQNESPLTATLVRLNTMQV